MLLVCVFLGFACVFLGFAGCCFSFLLLSFAAFGLCLFGSLLCWPPLSCRPSAGVFLFSFLLCLLFLFPFLLLSVVSFPSSSDSFLFSSFLPPFPPIIQHITPSPDTISNTPPLFLPSCIFPSFSASASFFFGPRMTWSRLRCQNFKSLFQ